MTYWISVQSDLSTSLNGIMLRKLHKKRANPESVTGPIGPFTPASGIVTLWLSSFRGRAVRP